MSWPEPSVHPDRLIGPRWSPVSSLPPLGSFIQSKRDFSPPPTACEFWN